MKWSNIDPRLCIKGEKDIIIVIMKWQYANYFDVSSPLIAHVNEEFQTIKINSYNNMEIDVWNDDNYWIEAPGEEAYYGRNTSD